MAHQPRQVPRHSPLSLCRGLDEHSVRVALHWRSNTAMRTPTEDHHSTNRDHHSDQRRRTHMKRHLTIWMAAALTVVLVAAGCSSDSSDGGSEGAGSDAPSTALVAEADEIVSAATERPTAMNIDTKIQGSIPQDGTLYFVECGAPACAELGDKVDEVAKSVGWESIRIQAGLTPETIKDAWPVSYTSDAADDLLW